MYQINLTRDDITSYPLHSHRNYEVMVYLSGKGYMKTTERNYPFEPSSVIIVPPETRHGSVSENGFKNISIEGEFDNIFHAKDIICFFDNADGEITSLAKLIYAGRFKNKGYLSALCSAFTRLIALETTSSVGIISKINEIAYQISEKYFDSELDLALLLKQSGYAPDYIRAQFKAVTQKTPSEFLNQVRINQARFLIDVYSDSLSLSEISEKCGYNDYVYFSRTFRSFTGLSPRQYKTSKFIQ